MDIPILGVAKYHRIVVSVLGEEFLKCQTGRGQVMHRYGNIFEKRGSAGFTCACNGRIQTFTDMPQVRSRDLIGRELSLVNGSKLRENFGRTLDHLRECCFTLSLVLNEKRGVIS